MKYESIVILISALLYASVGLVYLFKQNWSWGTVWLAYSIANFGLMVAQPK